MSSQKSEGPREICCSSHREIDDRLHALRHRLHFAVAELHCDQIAVVVQQRD